MNLAWCSVCSGGWGAGACAASGAHAVCLQAGASGMAVGSEGAYVCRPASVGVAAKWYPNKVKSDGGGSAEARCGSGYAAGPSRRNPPRRAQARACAVQVIQKRLAWRRAAQ